MNSSSINSRPELAQALGVTERALNYVCFKLKDDDKFVTLQIPKKKGGFRVVHAPMGPLRTIQRRLLPIIYEAYTPKRYVTGFVPNKSIVDNARIHRKRSVLINIDIQNFFESITFMRSRGALMSKPLQFGADAATAIANLCHINGTLAAGSPISPVISNLVCRRLDTAYRRLSTRYRLKYSRYADDMTFSGGQQEAKELLNLGGFERFVYDAKEIASQQGFTLNDDKTHIRSAYQRQQVTGLVTNAKLNVPRDFIRNLRVLIHEAKSGNAVGAAQKYLKKACASEDEAMDYLAQVVRGKIGFLKTVRAADPTMRGKEVWYDSLHWNYLSRAQMVFGCFEEDYATIWYERTKHPVAGTVYRPYEVCELAIRYLMTEALRRKWSDRWAKEVLSHLDENPRKTASAHLARLNAEPSDILHVLSFGEMKELVTVCWNEVHVLIDKKLNRNRFNGLIEKVLPWRNEEGHLRPRHLRRSGAGIAAAQSASALLSVIPPKIMKMAREHLEGLVG